MSALTISPATVATAYTLPLPGSSRGEVATMNKPQSLSTPVTDKVTLSPEAQTALKAQAGLNWNAAWVTDALNTLNDTSGTASEAQKREAYAQMQTLISDPSRFDPANPANAKAVEIATTYASSVFSQHVQDLSARMSGRPNTSWDESITDLQRTLNNFDQMSDDDRQTYVSTLNIGKSNPQDVESYRADRQAWLDINLAARAAFAQPRYKAGLAANRPDDTYISYDQVTQDFMSLSKQAQAAGDQATLDMVDILRGPEEKSGEAWTRRVDAYFAKYGGHPEQTPAERYPEPLTSSQPVAASADNLRIYFQNIATLNDSSGKSSIADKAQAFQAMSQMTLLNAMSNSPLRKALNSGVYDSTYAQQMNAAQQSFMSGAIRAWDNPSAFYSGLLSNLNRMSQQDQQIMLETARAEGQRFESLDSYKAYLQSLSDIAQVADNLLKRFGINNLSAIKDKVFLKSPEYQAFLMLKGLSGDEWTRKAEDVLRLFRGSKDEVSYTNDRIY